MSGSNINPKNTQYIPACPLKCEACFSRVVNPDKSGRLPHRAGGLNPSKYKTDLTEQAKLSIFQRSQCKKMYKKLGIFDMPGFFMLSYLDC